MTRTPHLLLGARVGVGVGARPLEDALLHDGLLDPFDRRIMGRVTDDGNEERGIRSAQQAYDTWYNASRVATYWELQIADPGATGLFATQVYNRGAATLHALRLEVGDEDFFAGARLWVERYNDSTATTADFQAVYEEVSGRNLDAFFQTWLWAQTKPPAAWTTP